MPGWVVYNVFWRHYMIRQDVFFDVFLNFFVHFPKRMNKKMNFKLIRMFLQVMEVAV